MARYALYSSLYFSLLLLPAPVAGTEEIRLLGGNRFFAGTKVHRQVRAPGLESGKVRWQILTFGAVVSQGEGTGPTLEFTIPPATRRIPATLRLEFGGDRTVEIPIEIVPRQVERLRIMKAWLRETPIGVIGAKGGLHRFLADQEIKFDELESPGAIRRSRGFFLFLAPGAWDVRPLWPAIIERARRGAFVIALGPDDAPWASAAADLPDILAKEPFKAWGRGEPIACSPLKPGEGNHLEVHPGLLRVGYPRKGKLVFCRLRLLAQLGDEPRAEEMLLDLLELSFKVPPTLRSPVRVLAPEGEETQWPWSAFRSGSGDRNGPVVAAELTPELEKLGKGDAGVLIVTPEASVFHWMGQRYEGPGTADRSGFAQFVTDKGIRLVSEKFWR